MIKHKGDRELLEAVARAADMSGWQWAQRADHEWGLVKDNPNGSVALWNPLADDGDAFRLAVMLNVDVETSLVHSGVVRADVWDAGIEEYRSRQEARGADSCAAARRAIVRLVASTVDGVDSSSKEQPNG